MISLIKTNYIICRFSSSGRAYPLQGLGGRFESCNRHDICTHGGIGRRSGFKLRYPLDVRVRLSLGALSRYSPTGRGDTLKMCKVRVRISLSVLRMSETEYHARLITQKQQVRLLYPLFLYRDIYIDTLSYFLFTYYNRKKKEFFGMCLSMDVIKRTKNQ